MLCGQVKEIGKEENTIKWKGKKEIRGSTIGKDGNTSILICVWFGFEIK